MIDDLRDQCNEFVADSVVDVKCPRPYDPMLSDQYIGIANYGKVKPFASFMLSCRVAGAKRLDIVGDAALNASA